MNLLSQRWKIQLVQERTSGSFEIAINLERKVSNPDVAESFVKACFQIAGIDENRVRAALDLRLSHDLGNVVVGRCVWTLVFGVEHAERLACL